MRHIKQQSRPSIEITIVSLYQAVNGARTDLDEQYITLMEQHEAKSTSEARCVEHQHQNSGQDATASCTALPNQALRKLKSSQPSPRIGSNFGMSRYALDQHQANSVIESLRNSQWQTINHFIMALGTECSASIISSCLVDHPT